MSEMVSQMINDLKLVLDITSRVDERVKIIAESQTELTHRLNKFVDEHNALAMRVKLLETQSYDKLLNEVSDVRERIDRIKSRMEIFETVGSTNTRESTEDMTNIINKMDTRLEKLETSSNGILEKAKTFGGLIMQGVWVVVVCYVLYKLGLQSPPTP